MENDFHVGRLIEQVLRDKGKTKAWLAKELNYGKSWAVELTKKDSISTAMLFRIGDALGYNFFEELARRVAFWLPDSGANGPTTITLKLALTKGVTLTEAIQYLETHFSNPGHENQSFHPLVLTRFSVVLGNLAGDRDGLDPNES